MTTAHELEVDSICYNIINSTAKTLEVTYRGSSRSNSYSGTVTIPSSVIYDGTTYSVIEIGDYAFYGCDSLRSITIPNTVKSIESQAFNNCAALESVIIGDSVTRIEEKAFYGCTSLTSLTIPGSVTHIGARAFMNCNKLEHLRLEDGVATLYIGTSSSDVIDNIVGENFTASPLKTLYLGRNISFYTFSTKYTIFSKPTLTSLEIGNCVTNIGLFKGCTSLKSVTIPNSVTGIGDSAFYGCTTLDSITIPNSVTNIGESAFYGCTSLKNAIIGEGITNIKKNAFRACTSLTDITIPDNVITISKDAFNETAWFNNQPEGLLYIGKHLLGYKGAAPTGDITLETGTITIQDAAFKYCCDVTTITMSDALVQIGDSAFYECSNLKSITIGSGVTTIGHYAFKNCNSLAEVHISDLSAWCNIEFNTTYQYSKYANPLNYSHSLYLNGEKISSLIIPDDVTEIKNYAFEGCHCLTSVIIGEGVTVIGAFAFRDCPGITDFTIGGNVNSVQSQAFSGCIALKNLSIKEGETTISFGSNKTNYNSIGEGLFYDCPLETISLERNITYNTLYAANAGYSPFYNKQNLKSITIGDDVTKIPVYAFYNCSGVTAIYSKAKTPPAIETTTFSNYSSTLYVPIGSKTAYKRAAYWSNFTNIVEREEDTTGINSITGNTSEEDSAVYDMQGRHATDLVNGRTYIKNGKKFIVK